MDDTVDFALLVQPVEATQPDTLALVPSVSGVRLDELVASFETAQGWTPAGGYGGIVPAHYQFGDLNRLFRGEQPPWSDGAKVPVLGCECGEWGCWPLLARIRVAGGVVKWSEFEQPHRPERVYDGLGSFRFVEADYQEAVRSAVAALAA